MDNSLFYTDVTDERMLDFVDGLKRYSLEYSCQIYFIKKALGSDATYSYEDAAILLIPKHKIVVVDYGSDADNFDEFYNDTIEDLGVLSNNHKYRQAIGRPWEWEHLLIKCVFDDGVSIKEFVQEQRLPEDSSADVERRKIELLISLMIGSINDIDKVGVEPPESHLDKVKRKVVLFDGMQSSFMYENVRKHRVTIQGLSGTGKTELLLHRLQKTYVNERTVA